MWHALILWRGFLLCGRMLSVYNTLQLSWAIDVVTILWSFSVHGHSTLWNYLMHLELPWRLIGADARDVTDSRASVVCERVLGGYCQIECGALWEGPFTWWYLCVVHMKGMVDVCKGRFEYSLLWQIFYGKSVALCTCFIDKQSEP